MHLHATDLFVEFLDPETGEPAEPGGLGEIVATHLGPRALPLVRYAPRDVFRLIGERCPCGNPSLRLQFVGQRGAFRKIKGVLVHPAQVRAALAEFAEVGRFQIVVEPGEGRRYERAFLRAGLRELPLSAADLKARIAAHLKATVLLTMDVELVPERDIPDTAGPPSFASAIVDRRHD
jgi:phenylacetate-CoA ligase